MAKPLRPLIDRVLGGTLDAELRARRERGDTFDAIARWLLTEHDIDVTSEAIRQWVRDLPDPEPEAASA